MRGNVYNLVKAISIFAILRVRFEDVPYVIHYNIGCEV